ncbi:hypothetical protein ACFW04_013785 [Cataglyphis niger]
MISNYRLSSKQCIMLKLFENIITYKILLLLKNIIINEQHNFIAERTVSTNLLLYHDCIVTALEEWPQVDTIYTVFKKVFDHMISKVLII